MGTDNVPTVVGDMSSVLKRLSDPLAEQQNMTTSSATARMAFVNKNSMFSHCAPIPTNNRKPTNMKAAATDELKERKRQAGYGNRETNQNYDRL